MNSDQRNEIIELLQQVHFIKNLKKGGKELPIFGVSSKYLSDFVTTEKDLQRNIQRIPPDYYLLNGTAVQEKDESLG